MAPPNEFRAVRMRRSNENERKKKSRIEKGRKELERSARIVARSDASSSVLRQASQGAFNLPQILALGLADVDASLLFGQHVGVDALADLLEAVEIALFGGARGAEGVLIQGG